MTVILAIDPGPEMSAFVVFDGTLLSWGKIPNADLLRSLMLGDTYGLVGRHQLVIEMIASYGMPVGAETFWTCVWIGRFAQAWDQGGQTTKFLYRADIKMHLCHRTAKINDAVIRQALIDRFGPGKDRAVGRKASPGPLYGLKADGWAALAVAVTASDQADVKRLVAA